MIRLGNKIRLTKKEKQTTALLTGGDCNTETVEGMNNLLEASKLNYSGDSSEEKLLRHLLESSKIS